MLKEKTALSGGLMENDQKICETLHSVNEAAQSSTLQFDCF